jgi:hypothetical protein
VRGCVFVNYYEDREEDDRDFAKHGGQMTCAMFGKYVPTSAWTNWGGQ